MFFLTHSTSILNLTLSIFLLADLIFLASICFWVDIEWAKSVLLYSILCWTTYNFLPKASVSFYFCIYNYNFLFSSWLWNIYWANYLLSAIFLSFLFSSLCKYWILVWSYSSSHSTYLLFWRSLFIDMDLSILPFMLDDELMLTLRLLLFLY